MATKFLDEEIEEKKYKLVYYINYNIDKAQEIQDFIKLLAFLEVFKEHAITKKEDFILDTIEKMKIVVSDAKRVAELKM